MMAAPTATRGTGGLVVLMREGVPRTAPTGRVHGSPRHWYVRCDARRSSPRSRCERSTAVRPEDVSSNVRWRAVMAGVLVATAAQIVLTLLGCAVATSLLPPALVVASTGPYAPPIT